MSHASLRAGTLPGFLKWLGPVKWLGLVKRRGAVEGVGDQPALGAVDERAGDAVAECGQHFTHGCAIAGASQLDHKGAPVAKQANRTPNGGGEIPLRHRSDHQQQVALRWDGGGTVDRASWISIEMDPENRTGRRCDRPESYASGERKASIREMARERKGGINQVDPQAARPSAPS